MNKILLVDDEQNVLNALRRELRDSFDVEVFDSPVAAIERCRETQFDLVVADYKMPEMNGINFLKQFGELQPDAARLMLSGEADIDALIRTINETHIYRFLAKPWEKDELLSNLHQALAYRDAILESRRTSSATTAIVSRETPYHIVLVDHDERRLKLMADSLTDESGRGNLYSAMQQEISKQSTEKFKCVVSTFRTARSALEYTEQNPQDMVIAAQSLSDMDGINLLSTLRETQPDVIRILISDNPDKELLASAINQAEIQSLLALHWDRHALQADVRRLGWNLYQLKMAVIHALTLRDIHVDHRDTEQPG